MGLVKLKKRLGKIISVSAILLSFILSPLYIKASEVSMVNQKEYLSALCIEDESTYDHYINLQEKDLKGKREFIWYCQQEN